MNIPGLGFISLISRKNGWIYGKNNENHCPVNNKLSLKKIVMKNIFIFVLLSLFSCISHATRITQIIHENISIEPNKSYVTDIQSKEAIRVGWKTTNMDCTTNCIESINKSASGTAPTISAQHGATLEYKPVNEEIIIEYKNVSDKPVTITIFTEKEICDSMACDYLKSNGVSDLHNYKEVKSEWKRIVSKNIFSFQTSKDGSYSIVKGESIFDTKYEITIIWWLIDDSTPSLCKEWIPKHGQYDLKKGKVYQYNGSYTTSPLQGIMYGVSCSFMPVSGRKNNDI